MRLSLFTHNLLYHRAFSDISKILKSLNPDIICLQEFEADIASFDELKKNGYLLAGSSNTFVRSQKAFCIATFYKESIALLANSRTIPLPRTHYETFLYYLRGEHTPRTVLKTDFKLKSGADLSVYNLHLTAFASNGGRVRQLIAALEDLRVSERKYAIFAGDFNYPYRRKKLEELMEQYSLQEATKNIDHTFETKLLRFIPLRLKDDYILYKGLTMKDTAKINWRVSDHYPLVSTFEI